MLSYRHSFHAGNFADVLKHIVLVLILQELTLKEKGFLYLDSHAGAGLYNLNSLEATKTAEYENGIAKLWNLTDFPKELTDYMAIIKRYNNANLEYYPGSPFFALNILRSQDRAILTELHPTDFAILQKNIDKEKKVKIFQHDGYQQIKASLPPAERRGLIFIDPSYEIKNDYKKVVDMLCESYKRFATGCYAIWYPVIFRQKIKSLLNDIKDTKIPNILNIEFGISADTATKGMTSSGMIVVNPPWKLKSYMQDILPYLALKLTDGKGHFKIETITAE